MKNKQTIKLHLDKWESIILESNDKIEVYYKNKKELWRPTEIAEKLERLNNSQKPNAIRIRLKHTKFKSKKLTIHPYIFSAWINDGSKRDGTIYVDAKDAKHHVDIFKSFGWKIFSNKNYGTVNVINLHSPQDVPLITILRKMGLRNNKQIPKEYIFNSMKNRILFLQSCFDHDGNVTKIGQYMWTQKRDDFAETITFLLSSIGVFSKRWIRNRFDKRSKKTYHSNEITCWPDKFDLVKLPKKLERVRNAHKNKTLKYLNNTRVIKKVEFLSQEGKENE